MHYYSEQPGGRYREYSFTVGVRGVRVAIRSASGVFSARKLDKGTEVLLRFMVIKDGWRILDLGCGYGVVGIVAAKLAPRGYVVLTDINRRAVSLARKNLSLNKVGNAEVRWGDLYDPVRGEKFNTILSNPPIAAGMGLVERLVEGALDHLYDGGLLQVVARHRKGGERIYGLMRDVYSEAFLGGGASGYRVYVGVR